MGSDSLQSVRVSEPNAKYWQSSKWKNSMETANRKWHRARDKGATVCDERRIRLKNLEFKKIELYRGK